MKFRSTSNYLIQYQCLVAQFNSVYRQNLCTIHVYSYHFVPDTKPTTTPFPSVTPKPLQPQPQPQPPLAVRQGRKQLDVEAPPPKSHLETLLRPAAYQS